MATHSSILAWEIPWTEEPGGLQFKGSQRVGQDQAIKHRKTKQILFSLLQKSHCVCADHLAIFTVCGVRKCWNSPRKVCCALLGHPKLLTPHLWVVCGRAHSGSLKGPLKHQEQVSTKLFCNGPDDECFRFAGHPLSVSATPFCHRGSEAAADNL